MADKEIAGNESFCFNLYLNASTLYFLKIPKGFRFQFYLVLIDLQETLSYGARWDLKVAGEPWLAWLSGLSIVPQRPRSTV